MGQTSICDIAKKAKVSASTVSRVLNNQKGATKETREKILKLAKQMNYVPNLNARFLRNRDMAVSTKKGCIGIVVPDLSSKGWADEFFSGVLNGVAKATAEEEIKLFTDIMKQNYQNTMDLPLTIRDRAIDGVLSMLVENTEYIKQLKSMEIPFVLMLDYCADADVDSVFIDDYKGGYEAVKYLIDKGHKRIGILIGGKEEYFGKERHRGYISALNDHGLEYSEELVEIAGSLDPEKGYDGTKRLLERAMPTAIFVINDKMAYGAVTAIRNKGLKIPDDVSIIGFDNTEFSLHTNPPLTTMNVDREKIGRTATRRLFEIINNGNLEPIKIIVTPTLLERETVRELK